MSQGCSLQRWCVWQTDRESQCWLSSGPKSGPGDAHSPPHRGKRYNEKYQKPRLKMMDVLRNKSQHVSLTLETSRWRSKLHTVHSAVTQHIRFPKVLWKLNSDQWFLFTVSKCKSFSVRCWLYFKLINEQWNQCQGQSWRVKITCWYHDSHEKKKNAPLYVQLLWIQVTMRKLREHVSGIIVHHVGLYCPSTSYSDSWSNSYSYYIFRIDEWKCTS